LAGLVRTEEVSEAAAREYLGRAIGKRSSRESKETAAGAAFEAEMDRLMREIEAAEQERNKEDSVKAEMERLEMERLGIAQQLDPDRSSHSSSELAEQQEMPQTESIEEEKQDVTDALPEPGLEMCLASESV
jgi:hypothetical protein